MFHCSHCDPCCSVDSGVGGDYCGGDSVTTETSLNGGCCHSGLLKQSDSLIII